MGLCPSRNNKAQKHVDFSSRKTDYTEKTTAKPAKSTLRADADEFIPSLGPLPIVPKAEWEVFLDAKRDLLLGKTKFTRRADGTFTGEYRSLLNGPVAPAEPATSTAPATGQVCEDVVNAWKAIGPFIKKKSRPNNNNNNNKSSGSKGALGQLSPKSAGNLVLLEAQRKPPAPVEPKGSADDSRAEGAEQRAVPFGLADRHYLSDAPDAGGSHVHRSRTPTPAREYVHAPITGELEDTLTEVLYTLRLLKDSEPEGAPRRYCVGIREVMRASKEKGVLKAVVVAPDLEQNGRASLDVKLQQLLASCEQSGTPVVFGLSRLRLGQAIKKSVTISVLGVLDTRGAQEPFARMLSLSK